MSKAIKTLQKPAFTEPTEPTADQGVAFEKWKVAYAKNEKAKESFGKNNKVFLTWRCSTALRRWR